MPTPKAGYFLKDGSRVPGTTTVIGRFKESAGLMQWSFQQGKAGKAHLYEESNTAADIGTCAHGMVELKINGADDAAISAYVAETLKDEAQREKARSAFHAYLKWAENFKVRVVAQEVQLVSELYRFGGTPDFVGVIGNQLALFDIKTSNSVYTDYLIQVAAYGQLWNENHPDQPITGGFHILRFAKDNADFGHHYFANLDDGWKQFLLFREAYDLDKTLKKRAA